MDAAPQVSPSVAAARGWERRVAAVRRTAERPGCAARPAKAVLLGERSGGAGSPGRNHSTSTARAARSPPPPCEEACLGARHREAGPRRNPVPRQPCVPAAQRCAATARDASTPRAAAERCEEEPRAAAAARPSRAAVRSYRTRREHARRSKRAGRQPAIVRPICARTVKNSSEIEYSTSSLILSFTCGPPTTTGSAETMRAATSRSPHTMKPAR